MDIFYFPKDDKLNSVRRQKSGFGSDGTLRHHFQTLIFDCLPYETVILNLGEILIFLR